MTINQIPTEERNTLCFDCEHCIQTIKGKECMLKEQHISRSEGTGMLVCGNREENAELKADRPQWHILAEEPNILPKEGQKVRVLTEEGTIEESTLFYDTYYEELAWSNIGLVRVFAWCEIPKEIKEND